TPANKPYPGSHHNNGVEIVPISILLQTLSFAAAQCGGSMTSDIHFEYPIVVDEPRVIQVVADGESVTVASSLAAEESGQRWVKHARARISRELADHSTAVPSPQGSDAGAEFTDESVTSFWQTWGSQGRPFDWSVRSCRSAADSLHADVELSNPSAVALLDAAIHVARLMDSANRRLMIPAGAASVRFDAEPLDPQGRIDVHRITGDDDELIVDIAVTAPDGSVCIDI